MQATKKIDTLTGARFTAIMLIVWSHFEFLYDYSIGGIYSVFNDPTMGVDFFFMLSGFGMMLSSIRKSPDGDERIGNVKTLLNFGWKHVAKIYPLYVLMLLLGIPYHIMMLVACDLPLFTAAADAVIKFFACLTLLQSATGLQEFSHVLNGVCWFLSSLFCIYLISPILMRACKRNIKNSKAAVIAIVASVLCSYILAIVFEWMDRTTRFDVLCYVSPYRRVFYVLCGMLVAQIYRFNQKNPGTAAFAYISVGFAMVWFILRKMVLSRIGPVVYIIDMAICICVLYGLALEKGKISEIFASRTMVYLGNISIYIFITHYLIRTYVDLIFRKLKLTSTLTALIEVIVVLVITFAVSAMLDRYDHVMKRNLKKMYDKYIGKIFPKSGHKEKSNV